MVMSSDENAVPTKPDKRRSVIAVTAHSRSDGFKVPYHSLGEENGYDQKCRDCGSRLRTLGLSERSVRWFQTFGRTPVRVQGRRIQTVQRIADQYGRRCRMRASEKVPS